jgi:hypothetical protein
MLNLTSEDVAELLEKEMRWAFALSERTRNCNECNNCVACAAAKAIETFLAEIAQCRLTVISAVSNAPGRPSASE